MAWYLSLKRNPRRMQVTHQQDAVTMHNAVLCSFINLKLNSDRTEATWVEGYADSRKDTGQPCLNPRSSSNTVQPCRMQNSFLRLVQVRSFFYLQFRGAQYRLLRLSAQEHKLNTHFSHFLSNFAFPRPRYDFIFKVKFFRSLAHND